jgi:hypothetical protein
MQSITVPSVFVNKAQYNTHHCDLYDLVGWHSLHTRRQTHWIQVIYKSLLGKAPPYLSSLVTIAAPTRSTRSSRYMSLVTPKGNSSFGRLAFQFSTAIDWNKLQKSLKLSLSTSCQSSSQITAPVHSSSVNSSSNLPHPHTVFIYLSCSFAPQYLNLHIHLLDILPFQCLIAIL